VKDRVLNRSPRGRFRFCRSGHVGATGGAAAASASIAGARTTRIRKAVAQQYKRPLPCGDVRRMPGASPIHACVVAIMSCLRQLFANASMKDVNRG